MAFTSFVFLAFLAVVVLLYYCLPKKCQWIILLVASYAFYAYGSIKQVIFIVCSTLVTYTAGRLMQKERDRQAAALSNAELPKEEKKTLKKASEKKIHTIQVTAVLINLGVLAAVKYVRFIVENINRLLPNSAQIPVISILVPLGISFYTFSSIGYLIDVGRGKYAAEKHICRFALYVSFFPSIIQGPINRFDDLGKQLQKEHSLKYDNIIQGAQLIMWGFFKKLVIADRAYVLVQAIFELNPSKTSGSVFVFGTLMYAVQIYCDFSGGIDIARGAGQMLDITLPENFLRPYFSTSVPDFWRRWHASLGAWMRDYVFYTVLLSKPVTRICKFFRKKIGGHFSKVLPSVITSFTVFFLIGIWHGASWKYVAFGLFNAFVVSAGVLLDPFFKKLTQWLHIDTTVFSWRVFQMIRTFLVLCIPKILVRSGSLTKAFAILKRIFTNPGFSQVMGSKSILLTLGLDQPSFILLFVCVLILLTVSILQESGMKMRQTIAKQNLYFRVLIWLALLAMILVFGMYGPAYNAVDFIYQAY